MEQVYVIKLKELPQPPASTTSTTTIDGTTINGIKVNSPFEGKDLNRQSLFGLSIFQLILGLLSIIFSLVGATRDWTHSFGVFSGLVYIVTSAAGILASEGPVSYIEPSASTSFSWVSFSRSSSFIWITLGGQFITLIISTLFTWLTMFGVICSFNTTINLQTSLITANGLQFILSLFSSFILCRILNPDFLTEYLPSWPDKPKVSSKIIVKTSIYPGVLKSDNFSRLLGPNCIVSLVPPNNNNLNRQAAIGGMQPIQVHDQATETEPDSLLDEMNMLSSTPKYFSKSTSSISSVSTASISAERFSPEIDIEILPTSEFEATVETAIEQKVEPDVEPDLKIVPSPEAEIDSGSEKIISSSSPSTESDSEQDSYSNADLNEHLKCQSLRSNNLHHTIAATATTAIH
ncbi:uncharacterized protein LOC107361915 [Tetranychus urticae]|uniref:Uncharacterized protein n=1 Tax=Tetranychus urticae TaxID=32264 RepID=T1K8G0_TETUR|nr:uncharacterized protein LOC107361915 [Tetranychus urticae]XP_015784350.1 uncharacterized protein LOC107361915 [Tetranychus urticae]XP_025016561.1 uncharacterized protein LOC107361915 [Tetranychus urticae]XP_025016562.1 uncharacterized protein LOC107361915 [Tetranychus urticae]XP_025016563.1 uncharacterized protein LOC107361915 [Tetranychus urticae]